MTDSSRRTAPFDFLAGGGEMGALMRSLDWSKTPLGPVDDWPQSLRSAVSICLGSRFPILVWWGRDLVMLYNDAYRPMLGATKHPKAMGQLGRECWPEIWHIIGPMLEDTVLTRGEATWSDDQLLVLDRNGYLEECYFTFSYSPIRDETGGVGGVFCAVTETTARVLGERRLRLLSLLATSAVDAADATEACRRSAAALQAGNADVPFALIYLLDRDRPTARLTAVAGVPEGTAASPPEIDLTAAGTPWPLGEAARQGTPHLMTGLRASHPGLPGGPWPVSADTALVVPITAAGQDQPAGFLVAGISPRRGFDDPYRNFLLLVAGHIGTAIADAAALETERRRAEVLAALDRAKTTFFSNVSHEFRTPLTLMLGPVTDSLEDVARPLDPAHRERLETAHRNSIRLLKLVNTLLDFSRIESGRVQAVYEPTDLAGFTADLASSFRSACERAGLRLIVDCEPLAEPIYVDRDMWEKIVLNLVSNAFKFTLQGEIEVTLRAVKGWVELAVRDTGTGIPEDELPRLFERFHRVHGARGRTQEGTGIGLALVQELVKLHGGAVAVESRVGHGSRFRVSVPTGKGHLPADRVGGARTLGSTALGAIPYVEEALRWLPGADALVVPSVAGDTLDGTAVSGPSPAGPVGAVTGPGERRARILWADDNADMREYVRRLLGRHYEVEAVADGLSALDAARARPPDLVLTDVMMPGLDGFALLRELRADERLRTIPVILLSARAGEEARVEGMHAGADDYLIKPFSARELLTRVEAHLKLQQVRRESQAALRESEAKFSTAFDASPLVLTITSLDDGRLVEVNEAFVRLAGYTRADALGRTPDELGLWIDPDRRVERFARLRVGERVPTIEARFRAKSGVEIIGLISSAVVEINGRPCVLSSVTDITDRKRAEEALQAADRAKDEFLAMLGHELRNPLGALASAARLLDREGRTPEMAARARDVIGRQLDHLTRLVDDLLDVSRLTTAKVRLSRRPLDLSHAARGAVETLRARGALDRHRLSFEGHPAWVDADETRIEQIVANLVGNAMKFTPPGGSITVTVGRDDLDAVLEVKDTGIGIPAEALPRIFDLFVQGERTLDRAQGGLGIGLTLVRRLVELHGGTVQASSEGVGKGSVFTVRLPAVHPPAAHAAARSGGQPAECQPRRVLIVEDNDDAREMLRVLLAHDGHEVHEAVDGPGGLQAALTLQPDIALVDVGLPGLDGYALARSVRAHPNGQRVVLVALTGYGQPEDRRRGEEAGFDAHVVKPVDPAQLALLLARS